MDIKHVAKLANIPLRPQEEERLQKQFGETLKTIEIINELDTSQVPPTSSVTGTVNRTRPDQIDQSRILTQEQALSNAPSSENGYFKVPAIFDQS